MQIIITIDDTVADAAMANIQALNGWTGLSTKAIADKVQEQFVETLRQQVLNGKDAFDAQTKKTQLDTSITSKIT